MRAWANKYNYRYLVYPKHVLNPIFWLDFTWMARNKTIIRVKLPFKSTHGPYPCDIEVCMAYKEEKKKIWIEVMLFRKSHSLLLVQRASGTEQKDLHVVQCWVFLEQWLKIFYTNIAEG